MLNRKILISLTSTLAALTLSACGNAVFTKLEGYTGLSLNGQGNVEIHAQPCGLPVNHISVSGEGGSRGELLSDKAHRDYFSLDLESPPSSWATLEPVVILPDEELIFSVQVMVEGRDAQTRSVTVTRSKLMSLSPNEVLIGRAVEGETVTSAKVVTKADMQNCS